MNEDDIYRTSTQFRFWTYTARALSDLRTTSNKLASTRVLEAIKRARAKEGKPSDCSEIDCLTVDEEQKIVRYYCGIAMASADFPKAVKATAVQFLKRFYLSNSPMTYHPKQMMLSATYLATKVENFYISVADFARMIPKVTPEEILAPEFLLTQGLRFTFDVRHPYRGLEGGIMELLRMGRGEYAPPAGSKLTSEEVQHRILGAGKDSRQNIGGSTAEEFADRLKKAHKRAEDILTTGALFTDAYFLYTPSQIWLSALLAVDKPLAEVYLHILLSGTSGADSSQPSALELRLKSHLEECAGLMTKPSSRGLDEVEHEEAKRIGKKMYQCQNPEKLDIVGMNKAAKQGVSVVGLEGEDDEKIVKKRKMERERASKEGEDLFGAPLKK